MKRRLRMRISHQDRVRDGKLRSGHLDLDGPQEFHPVDAVAEIDAVGRAAVIEVDVAAASQRSGIQDPVFLPQSVFRSPVKPVPAIR